ncbi:MAG: carbohydrate ABC transporter permease [Clostridiales bacterium]|jgi:putative aldouronate transport system permease protein|nr:carbohydrate ABC transporter permease [Clostridiales bacterium]
MMAVVRETRGDRIFMVINYVILGLIGLAVAYPIIYVLSASFSDPIAITEGKVFLLPVGPTLENYSAVVNYSQLWTGYRNSIFYTIAGTALNLVLTLLMAYPLSEKVFPFKRLFMGLLTFTMLFNGGLIPTYLLMRQLGFIDTIWVLIIPGGVSVYNVIVTRTFLESSVPQELREAAEIDGCSHFRIFIRVALPLSGAIIAVMALFYGTGHWGAYFNAMIYIRTANLQPLQVVLRNILLLNTADAELIDAYDPEVAAKMEALKNSLKYSIIVLATAPMLIIYPFVQKYFVKGVMVGSLKG